MGAQWTRPVEAEDSKRRRVALCEDMRRWEEMEEACTWVAGEEGAARVTNITRPLS